ncbi:MAG: hypothetical protein LUB61_02875 [Eggerthellaceae bacterium]|nr:hypothetical protein [Eggerthellaceae bacterium]
MINPDTRLPYYASEVWPDYVQTTPEDTPVYVCVDEDTGELTPLPFGYPEDISKTVNPSIFSTATINGVKSRSAGQIYKDTVEPYTLEKAEELCWIPADLIEEAIHIYADEDVAGIACGVATDQQQESSQVPIGVLGLDMIMGYVNKPGATLTQLYYGQGGNELNPPLAPGEKPERPTMFSNGLYGMFSGFYGHGYEIGLSDNQNAERIAAMPEGDFPGALGPMYINNQLCLDRLGTRNHQGLNGWAAAHIPSVLEAIKTGIPYKPRVWFDMSGNKMAVLGNAGSWYDAFDEIDYCICMYPNLTSFQMEVADLVFPVEEWLEYCDASIMPQLNYIYGYFPVIHLGETVSSTVVMVKVVNNASSKLNEKIDSGEQIILGAIGATEGLAPANPTYSTTAVDDELQTDANGTYVHECDQSQFNLRFPIGVGVFCGAEEDSVQMDGVAENWDAPSFDELYANPSKYQIPKSVPKDEFWTYDNHLVEATDGLPRGFATESRKCEVYATAFVKMSQTGWPYNYPREQVACDSSIGSEIKEINPDYEWEGMYSPIVQYVEPAESPVEGMPGYDPEYPYVITSGRLPYFHHGTMRHAPYARELYPAPEVKMNPNTAAKYGLEPMDWVKVTSRRGSITGRVVYNKALDERVLWMERFWNPESFDSTQENKSGGWQQMNINVLTKNTAPYNEAYGSYTNRGFTVKIEKGERPDGVWVEPEEFEPFMPTTTSELYPDIGCVIDQPQTPHITFDDWSADETEE